MLAAYQNLEMDWLIYLLLFMLHGTVLSEWCKMTLGATVVKKKKAYIFLYNIYFTVIYKL